MHTLYRVDRSEKKCQALSFPMENRVPLVKQAIKEATEEYHGLTGRYDFYSWSDISPDEFVVSLYDNHGRITVEYFVSNDNLTDKDFFEKV